MIRNAAAASLLLFCAAAWAAEPDARVQGEVWEEARETALPAGLDPELRAWELPDATWVLVEAAEPPLAMRITRDEGRITGICERELSEVAPGLYQLWTPPGADRVWAFRGAERVLVLRAGWTRPGADELRPLPGRPWLPSAPGVERRFARRGSPINGPALLTVRIRLHERGSGRIAPFDLVALGPDGAELRRLPTTLWIPVEGEPAVRQLRLSIEGQETVAALRLDGAAGSVEVSVHRLHGRLSRKPPERLDVDEALIDRIHREARAMPEGPPALTVLEDALRSRAGHVMRREEQRALLSAHVRDATAYGSSGIRIRSTARSLLTASATSETTGDGRHLKFLSEELRFSTNDPEGRWEVVRFRLLDINAEPSVLGLEIDGRPFRVLSRPGLQEFRVAFAPGDHLLRGRLPEGIFLIARLPVSVPGNGPWQAASPRLLQREAAELTPAAPAMFELPEHRRHLRLELWWPEEEEPPTLLLRSGREQRRLRAFELEQRPLGYIENLDLRRFRYGRISVSFEDDVRRLEVRAPASTEHGAAFLRLEARGPRPRPLPGSTVDEDRTDGFDGAEAVEDEVAPDIAELWAALRGCDAGCTDTLSISAAVERAVFPLERARLLLKRAEILLDRDHLVWARADLERALVLVEDPTPIRSRILALEEAFADRRSRRFMYLSGERSFVVLDKHAAVADGVVGPLSELAAQDPAHAILNGRWADALRGDASEPILLLEQAKQVWDEALHDPRAALRTVLLTERILADISLGGALALHRDAYRLTRWDHMGLAASAGDRILLETRERAPMDPDLIALIGAGRGEPDAVISGGRRWVQPIPSGAPSRPRLSLRCTDLAGPSPDPCRVEVAMDGLPADLQLAPDTWMDRTLDLTGNKELSVRLARGGRDRRLAIGLEWDDFRPPEGRQAYHVAWPGTPVIHRVEHPTLLRLRVAPRADGRSVRARLTDTRGRELASWSWNAVDPVSRSDQGAAYGAVQTRELILEADSVGVLRFETNGGAVALRMDRRVPDRTRLPSFEPIDEPGREAHPVPAELFTDPTLPRRAALNDWGSIQAELGLRMLNDLEEDELVAPGQFLRLRALHSVRIPTPRLYLSSAVEGRLHFLGSSSAALDLGLRWEEPGRPLRMRAALHGVLQRLEDRTAAGLTGSAAVLGRFRLEHDLHVEPLVGLRFATLPLLGDPRWDPELRSIWRFQHPVGWYGRLRMILQPWTDAAVILALRARSNAELYTLDRFGADIEFRWLMEPVVLAVSWHPSYRPADKFRLPAAPYHVVALRAEADLRLRGLWLRPAAHLRLLPVQRKVSFELRLRFEPGPARSAHRAPSLRRFDSLRRVHEQRWEQVR